MKFKRPVKYGQGLESINIAPLIDVIFQLLIFFMLSSSFAFPSGIDIKLPQAITSDIIREENIVITITGEDVVYFNNKIVTLKELERLIVPSAKKNRPVLIKSDRRASMGRIVDVWDMCRKSGVERINIATDQDIRR